MYNVHDRISVGGHLGTVRYRGPIPNWEVDALGIEWDAAARGKHSGALGGVHYFSVSQPGSGSFVRSDSPRIDAPISFMQAVKARYASSGGACIQQVPIGRKVWQSYGLEKLNELSNQYHRLPVLMVEKQCISHAGDMELLQATTLDVSFNLFSRWAEVQHILEAMPAVESINLNGNRIADFHLADFGPATSVLLSETKITARDLGQARLAHVTSLVLAANSYAQFDVQLPGSVQSLDLSHNDLEAVPAACVQDLRLAHNAISGFSHGNASLQSLDVRWNPIASFSEIDKLPSLFPNLRDLKLDHVALGHGEDLFVNLVCRVPGLQRLNGSELSAAEVKSCELFFISKVQRGELAISNSHTWASLLSRHNIHDGPRHEPESFRVQLFDTMRLQVVHGGPLFSRVFVPTTTVLRLKGIVSTRMHIPFWDLQLYFYLSNGRDLGRQYLDNDMLTLEAAGLEHQQKVFVEVTPKTSEQVTGQIDKAEAEQLSRQDSEENHCPPDQ